MLWDIEGGRPQSPPTTLPPRSSCDPLLGVSFSPDGTLAAGCADGNAVLWDIVNGTPQAGPLTLPAVGACSAVYGLTFASGGRALALGCGDGTTVLWDIVPWATTYATVRIRVCGIFWGNINPTEWRILVPGLPYQRSCPSE